MVILMPTVAFTATPDARSVMPTPRPPLRLTPRPRLPLMPGTVTTDTAMEAMVDTMAVDMEAMEATMAVDMEAMEATAVDDAAGNILHEKFFYIRILYLYLKKREKN